MFELKLLVSFFVGGLLIAIQTLVAERVPSKWKGVILSVPSTMAIGYIFIGLVGTPSDVVEASLVLPVTLGLTHLFVGLVGYLSRFGISTSFLISFFAWSVGAYFILKNPTTDYIQSIYYFIPLLLSGYFLVRNAPKKIYMTVYSINFYQVALRSLIGGSMVVFVTYLSHALGNTWAGVFSLFPATYTSIFLIVNHTQGKQALPYVAKSLFFPGSIGFLVYGWAAFETYPEYGLFWGTVIAYAVTIAFLVGWNLLKPQDKKLR